MLSLPVRSYAIGVQNRRQFLAVAGVGLGLAPVVAWFGRAETIETSAMTQSRFPAQTTDAEWRATLTPEQYRVLRGRGTERAFTSPLNNEKRRGTFLCAACGHPLFSSATKYDSGTGWPSFWKSLDNAVGTSVDRSVFMVRTEVHCARCGSHLGHVFLDGPQPTGQRFCMNGVAMTFQPET
ncbi:MAG: peptide-methionine (R)-S-oxide reductase MsrB [Acidobacteria bacterium]|nr:peptide-methionine (R)-S-oxide reductase MsrB [Acidobacteriota bacterium]